MPTYKPSNPLSIIGLFISFMYSAFALFFSVGSTKLDWWQTWSIIAFLTVFPFVILILFFLLVTRHHRKLYSPSEFKDEKLVFGDPETVSLIQRKEEVMIQEAQEIVGTSVAASPTRVSTVTNKLRAVEWLALRKIETEFNLPVQREAPLHFRDSKILADGLITQDDALLVFEVRYINQPSLNFKLFSMIRLIGLLDRIQPELWDNFQKRIILYVVLVYDDAAKEQKIPIEAAMNDSLSSRAIEIRFKSYELSDLQREFGI